MTAVWTAVRPGNWIFHCHFAGHITSDRGLNQDRRYPDKAHDGHHEKHYMYGLVLGIEVEPRGALKASTEEPRALRLLMRSKPNAYGDYSGYAYVLGGTKDENDPAAMPLPGPTLVLQKDQPVAITLINRTHESAAVHWHGIELESFPDGVPGWSGSMKELLPSIPPGDSLTVRFTPPRAGTFMYHSHSNEMQQIGSGLYGAIVVLEKGQTYDPETDRIMLLSDNGPIVNVIKGPFPRVLLNGQVTPAPIELKAGTRYRFRVINIRAENRGIFQVLDGDKPVEWKMIARDGADLPASQVKLVPVKLINAPGQIWDFEYTPAQAADLTLRFGYTPNFPEAQVGKPTEVAVRVR
jgi:manganese oxidase